MASIPTQAECEADHKNVVKIFDDYETSALSSFVSTYDTLINGAASDASSAIIGAIDGVRSSLSRVVSRQQVKSALEPVLRSWMLFIQKPDLGFTENCRQLRDWMVANSETFNSGNITHGTVSAAGGNTGSGTVYRLNVDEDDYELEAVYAETLTFKCLTDQNSGAEFRERFEVRGQRSLRDLIEIDGSGLNTTVTAKNARDSEAFLNNPLWSIESATPAAGSPVTPSSVTDITGWTLDAVTGVTVDADTVYRGSANTPLPLSLRFTQNRSITQVFNAELNPTLSAHRPLFVQWAVYRESSADGTLTTSLGAEDVATALSGLSNGAWNLITHTLDKNRYLKNYNEADVAIVAALTSNTTGSIYIAPPIVCYMDAIGGTFWTVVGGATSFLRGDTFTAANSYGARGKIKYWTEFRSGLVRELNDQGQSFSFPSDNATTETIADPS